LYQRRFDLHNKIILSHLFCLFILFGVVVQNLKLSTIYEQTHFALYLIIGLLIFIADCFLFLHADYNKQTKISTTLINIIYIGIPLLAICVVIYITKSHSSMMLLILPILIAGSEASKTLTYIISFLCISSVVVLSVLTSSLTGWNEVVRENFNLICILLLTGWFCSTVSEIESNHRNQLNTMANTDDLTGLYNYRAFITKLNEYEKNGSINHPISIIFIDIDDFKNFNDSYGHPQGDIVISLIGQLLKETVAPQAFAARYGGEEFVVVLPNADTATTVQLAEQIIASVKDIKYPGISYLDQPLTISCGVATMPAHASTFLELIKNADHALYKAKSLGKNRVEIYSSIFDDLIGSDEAELKSIQTLIYVINAKDRYTYGHSERVVEFSAHIGNALHLNPETLRLLKYAAYLHDVGKIEIDRSIVNKPGKLTFEEFTTIKKHSVWGCEIVQGIPELRDVAPIILHHHENYDGSGYPVGISGEEIPLLSRIIRVVDSFDAMISDRPYRASLSLNEALLELERGKALQFDPEIVDVLNNLVNGKEASGL